MRRQQSDQALRELEKFGLIERKRRDLGKPSLVYVKNFSAESSKSIFQNRDFHDSGGFKNASQDPSKSRCNKTKENDTEMSETDPFYSEESDEMSKRTQLEEFFSQSLEVELLLRLCPDDEDTIYQIVDLLVDTCATKRKMLHIAGDDKPAEVVRSRFMKLNADHGKPVGRPKEHLLPRLLDQRLRRYGNRHWCCRTVACAAFHGRPAGDQDHHPFLRQADHRCDGEAVDRHLHAAKPLQPGDLFSGRIPCAKPLGNDHGQGAEGDHQKRVLCVRLCAQPCPAADL